jgi:paraquat-inducible protein B
MSKKANTTIIGGFVVGAVALFAAGVLIFGTGKFLSERATFVMFFGGSVDGLNVGSPVLFRGVRVGEVTDVFLRFDPADMSTNIPVYVELVPNKIVRVRGKAAPEKYIQMLVERGMRAQLQVQSMVTSQLMVNFDFHPDKPIKLVGIETEYPEIPTIPSSFEELSKRIKDLPLDELINKLLLTVEGIERKVNSPELDKSITSLNEGVKDVRKLVRNIDGQVGPLTSSIEKFVKNLQNTMKNADSKIEQLASNIEKTSDAGRATLKTAEKTLASIESMTAENSTLRYILADTLDQLSAAARSIRVMADYLERHPEALLRGKGGS